MTRVKFLFDNEFTWRSYYESGILSKLEECFEIHYLMINLKNKFEIQNAEYIKLNKFLSFFLTLNSFSYWTKKRLLSNSFKIRILSIIMGRRLFFEKKISCYLLLLYFILFYFGTVSKLIYRL